MKTQTLRQWKQIVGPAPQQRAQPGQLAQMQRMFDTFTRAPGSERLQHMEQLVQLKLERSPHYWPYAVLALFHFCLEQWEAGFELLKQARNCSTHPSELEALMDWLREQEAFQVELESSEKQEKATVSTELQGDPDQIYFELKADLSQDLQAAAEPLEPSASSSALNKQRKQLKAQQQRSKRYAHLIAQLDAELDTGELSHLYAEWLQGYQRLEELVKLSETLNVLWSLLERDLKESSELQRQIIQRQDLDAIRRACEQLLEHCDHMQNQMLRLEEQGVSLDELQPAYEALFESLEDIQSQLEELGVYTAA